MPSSSFISDFLASLKWRMGFVRLGHVTIKDRGVMSFKKSESAERHRVFGRERKTLMKKMKFSFYNTEEWFQS